MRLGSFKRRYKETYTGRSGKYEKEVLSMVTTELLLTCAWLWFTDIAAT